MLDFQFPEPPHLVTVVPLAPAMVQEVIGGYTVLVVRTSAMNAVGIVRIAFQLDESAPLEPRHVIIPLMFHPQAMDMLFSDSDEGRNMRMGVLVNVPAQIEHSRQQYERSHLSPFGEKGASA